MAPLSGEWLEALKGEFHQPYYTKLYKTVMQEYQTRKIFPPADDMFNAFHFTPLSQVKVVILGQDPYHGPHQAHGLCFSVLKGIAPPPSLKNIFRELSDDVGFIPPHHGELTEWAKQGVLMLNSVLTVREHQPNSHKGMGWEIFTDRVISELNKKTEPVVFLLWGANARQKAKVITNPIHVKLETVHPSPLSAYNGFFGCKHFSKCNQILADSGQRTIEWQLSD